jgi:TonB family protein
MAARPKPIQKFGPYLLLKELENDAFGQTWRAARIEGAEIAATVVLRRFTGGDREATRAAVDAAAALLPQIAGNAIAREQRVAVVDTVPVLEFEYVTGRSLRTILDRARGVGGANPNPIPPDQVLAIIDKIVASLEALGTLRSEKGRLFHGALIPQFVWISDSGDIRVAGQLLGSALIRALATPAIAQQFAPYVAPEIRATGEPTKASEVFASGAILYALLTGQEPPDAASREAFDLALARPIAAASKAPLPDELRSIVQKALAIDPSHRYPSITEFHAEISKLLASGRYAPTTFNLAFYLHTLLKKELESEPAEREREAKINVARYLEEEAEPAPPPSNAPFQQQAEDAARPKSKTGLIAAVLAIAVAGGGFAVWKFVLSKPAAVKTAANPAATKPVEAAALPIIAPIVTTTDPAATLTTTDTTANVVTATTTVDPEAARKKMIEEEITRRYQQELLKMQADADRARQTEDARRQPPPAAAATPAAPRPVERAPETHAELPAAALDQARRAQQEPAPTATVATATQAPVTPAPQQQVSAPAPALPVVREGDLVSIGDVDQMPRALQTRKPIYPPLAMRQKITAEIVVSALVSENGTVLDTKILRGEQRKLGFNEAGINAARQFTFVPAMKDGKRVRTWVPIPFEFKIQ